MVKLLNVAAILVSCVGLVHAVPMEEVQWSIWHDVAPEWNEAAVLVSTTYERSTTTYTIMKVKLISDLSFERWTIDCGEQLFQPCRHRWLFA